MIHDTLTNAYLYGSLHPNLKAGLDFLQSFQADTPDGRIDLNGDDLFALVQSYETTPSSEKRFEVHRTYADLQFLVSGRETIVYSPLSRIEPETDYDPENDYALCSDADDPMDIALRPGDFTVFYPADAHKPGCHHRGPSSVRKVVIKVRL